MRRLTNVRAGLRAARNILTGRGSTTARGVIRAAARGRGRSSGT